MVPLLAALAAKPGELLSRMLLLPVSPDGGPL